MNDVQTIKQFNVEQEAPEGINNILVQLEYSKDGYSGLGRGYYLTFTPNHQYDSGRVYRYGCPTGRGLSVLIESTKRFSSKKMNEILNLIQNNETQHQGVIESETIRLANQNKLKLI